MRGTDVKHLGFYDPAGDVLAEPIQAVALGVRCRLRNFVAISRISGADTGKIALKTGGVLGTRLHVSWVRPNAASLGMVKIMFPGRGIVFEDGINVSMPDSHEDFQFVSLKVDVG